jgi:uncharacterized membrane protein YphA (DoxX/SURF4 family)
MKILSNVFRVLIGIVFIFSGFVKVVDVLGVSYKFLDYFQVMGLEFLQPMALVFGILLSVAELMIGVSLLFNLLPKLGAWGNLLFMSIFFPLTFWIAIANPVQDCGCFGDALILSNWATFWKNVVIMFMTIIIFLNRKKFTPIFPAAFQWGALFVVGIAVFILSIFCLNHLPVIDFRPYRIGESIQEGMIVPESEKDNMPVYETFLTYENVDTGELTEFDLNNIPEGDNWEWRETDNKLVKHGYVPPIHDFTITTIPTPSASNEAVENIDSSVLYDISFHFEKDGKVEEFLVEELPNSDWSFVDLVSEEKVLPENVSLNYENNGEVISYTLFDLPNDDWSFVDAQYFNETIQIDESVSDLPEDVTDIVLADEDLSFYLVSYDIDKASYKNSDKINKIYEYCQANEIPFYALTASTEPLIDVYVDKTNAIYDFYNTDPITLKTIVRSNPGLVLVQHGVVLDKWHYNDIPNIDEFSEYTMAHSIEKQVVKSSNYYVLVLVLSLMLAFALLHLLVLYLKKKRIIIDRKSWN